MANPSETRKGLAYGAGAYLFWGLVAPYFKAVRHVPVLEVLTHRVLWMAACLLTLLAVRGRLAEVGATLADRTRLRALAASTLLIAVNWLAFIFAIVRDRLLDASLGYFLCPLVSVALGIAVLGERPRRLQLVALALAALGVATLAASGTRFPWLALLLAVTFALYGLARKTMRSDALVGLAVEGTLLAPFAIGYALSLAATGTGTFAAVSRSTDLLLVLAGPVTALPLLLFVAAARRLPLATLGVLQYLSPSLQFLLAVLLFGEPFTRAHAIAFGLIWSAVALYLADLLAARDPAAPIRAGARS